MMSRRLLWLCHAAIFSVCLACFFHVRLLLIDDGFIAHRYAANLVHGFGLVFNRGQRVEGVSDLSWVLLVTIPQLFGWRPELFAIATGAACGMAALMVAFHTAASRLEVPPPIALGVVCLAACNADYWIAAANGIETGLYTLVLTGAFALLVSRRLLWAGTLLGFATTLRPESLALAPLAFAALALADHPPPPRTRRLFVQMLRINGRLLLPWAVIVCGVVAWRFSYYGELVPNTVIAKSHPLHLRDLYFGTKYLFLFAVQAAPWVLLPLALFLGKLDLASILGLAWLSYQVLVIMLNGGDWMFGFRFLNCFFPLLAILSARGMSNLVTRRARTARNLGFGALAVIVLITQAFTRSWTVHRGILQQHSLVELVPPMYEPYYLNVANALKPALLPSDIVAPEVLGVVSYVLMDSPMHDWLGLVDSHIAHHGTVYFPTFGKADPAYSVNVVSPAVFLFASGPSTLAIFERETKGSFGQKYRVWQVIGQPLILAMRNDRERDLLAAIRRSNLEIRQVPL